MLTIPITILTLGLFLLVINALIILIASSVISGFYVDGFWWARLFSIILSSEVIKNFDFRFKQLSINDGLSQNSVRTIIQDKYGYMWFGTQDGLNMFDGYNFKYFNNNPLDSLSLSDNWNHLYQILKMFVHLLCMQLILGVKILFFS